MALRLIVLVIAIASAALGVVAGKLHSRQRGQQALWEVTRDVRIDVIRNHIDLTHGPRYLVIGDSFADRDLFPVLCGHLPINAGISGATTDDWLPYAADLIRRAQPAFIVIALGTNDGLQGKDQGFGARLKAIAADYPTSRIIVLPLVATPKLPHPDALNAAIRSSGFIVAPSIGKANSVDGIHLDVASYAAWNASIARAAERIGCR